MKRNRQSHTFLKKSGQWGMVLLFICLIVIIPASTIQAADPGKVPSQFEYLSLPDTAYITQIRHIFQDSRGFMWFSTEEKLYRFDGYDFMVFPKDISISTKWENDNLTTTEEDWEGNIWIGTEKGLFRLNRKLETIETVDSIFSLPGSKISHDFITCLHEDRNYQIWVGTTAGIYLLDPKQKTINRFRPDSKNAIPISNEIIKDITENSAGEIWIATNRNLYHLKPNRTDFQVFPPAKALRADAISNSLKNLFIDQDNILWIGTSGEGLFYWSPQANEFFHFYYNPNDPTSISGNYINHICEDQQGRIWIGYQGTGIDIYNKESKFFWHLGHDPLDQKSLSTNVITSLFSDRSSTIWIGTNSSILNYWNPFTQKFRLYRNISRNIDNLAVQSIHSFCEDDNGRIWIGGYDGIDLFDSKSEHFIHLPKEIWNPGRIRVVYSIPSTRDPAIWLGIENGKNELIKLNPNSFLAEKKYDFHDLFNFKGAMVITLLAENEKILWIGTDHGLFKMDIETEQFIPLFDNPSMADDLNNDQINVLYQDKNKKIWAGTHHSGLICIDTVSRNLIRHIFNPEDVNTLSINEVISIEEDQQRKLWVGTSRGLNQFESRNNKFIRYTKEMGLPDNTICGILSGSQDDLWLSTTRGLSRFHITNKSFRSFNLDDGLQSLTFNRGAYFKSKKGEMYFGGIRGFNRFYSSEAQINLYIPPVRITDFKISNRPVLIGHSSVKQTQFKKSISETVEARLSHKDKTFTLNFAALNFIFPQKNEYAIMMEGLDENWIHIGHQRFATYSGLPPGKYVFRVKASNNEGLWNHEGTALKIFIARPFFSQAWVKLIGFFLFLLMVFLIYTFRHSSLKRKAEEFKNNYLKLTQEITEFKNADDEIRASEEKYRHLVESSNDAIYILYKRKYELINQKFKEMFKVTQEHVISPEFDYLDLVAMKSKNFVEKRIQQIIEGEKVETQFNFTALSLDKKELEMEASVTTIKYQDGIAVQGILRDITERKNMEKMIQQAQKLEALGTLAGGIAHDFNNLLTGIQGRVSLMQMGFDKKDSQKDHLKEMEQYVKNAADLTKQLLGFARKGKLEVKPININRLIKDNIMMFGRTRKELDIKTQYQEDLWSVEVDPGQMDQVFMNLFVNAWQAMPDGGDILVGTKNVFLDYVHTKPHLVNPGKFVKISVTDTGKGMDEDTKQRIFDPFFTTKERGRGTGLGLATVYGILKNHGGFITVHSELGIGSTFDIFLPASSKRPVVETVAKEEMVYGTETILLVDDEEIVIEVVGQILESLGYNVFVAHSGKEAIEIYWGNKNKIDLIILDMVMPQMSGAVTYERLHGIAPGIKVLLSSGYSVDGQASELLKKGCNGFIQKPFNTKELSRKIREVLDGKPESQDKKQS